MRQWNVKGWFFIAPVDIILCILFRWHLSQYLMIWFCCVSRRYFRKFGICFFVHQSKFVSITWQKWWNISTFKDLQSRVTDDMFQISRKSINVIIRWRLVGRWTSPINWTANGANVLNIRKAGFVIHKKDGLASLPKKLNVQEIIKNCWLAFQIFK